MMATIWGSPNEEDETIYSIKTQLCQDVANQSESPVDTPLPLEDEPFGWAGPKTLRLLRTSAGFGFTLRHFIVYPPESAVHSTFKEEDNDHRGRPRNRLEPMDTIFVKQVKEGGPAHGAGLCTGDRIVKVNGESVIGKTYSQVISLIQDSDTFLELCVMPKDEDILQLAYSQDAYLKGHDAYSGHARHIPEPPSICYPRVDCKPLGMAEAAETPPPGGLAPDLGYRVEISVPPSPPPRLPLPQTAVYVCNDSVRTVVVAPPDIHLGHVGAGSRADYAPVGPEPLLAKSRPGAVSGGRPQYLHARNADAYMSGYHGDPYTAAPIHYSPASSVVSPATRQNIDWRTYQTYREYIDHKGLHSYSRTIQERLDSLRAAAQSSRGAGLCALPPAWPGNLRRRSTSHERSYVGPPALAPRSASQDRAGGTARPHDWPPRSVSSDGLLRKPRVLSPDYAEHGELVPRPGERRGCGRVDQGGRPSRQALPQRSMLYPHAVTYGSSIRGRAAPHQLSSRTDVPPPPVPSERLSRVGKNQAKEPQPKDQRAAMSIRVSVPAAGQQSRVRAETMQSPEAGREAPVGQRSSSCSAPPPQTQQAEAPSQRPHPRDLKGLPVNGRGPVAGVVLRDKSAGKSASQPLRHPSYILAVNDTDVAEPAGGGVCWLPNDARREVHMRRLGEQRDSSACSSNLDESLDSIPFIDEPASPSVDRGGTHIPASAVISSASAGATDTQSPKTPSPHMRRQLSHDQESLRNAILEQSGTKKERSKSYDEGLDNYREEEGGRSSKSSLKVFKKALDGHKSSDDSCSRRDSSSDIFTDSSKEGWLHFRQLIMDKSKRVGGGMRPWKQMYAVLRGHSLYLYKDRREALAHVNSQLEDEPQPVSVKACLIDISYSDTKRKNVLRLTTSDCEYLFQAEGRDDMLSWIRVIQENSNLDEENAAVTSTDLINRKIKEYISMSTPPIKTEPSPKALRQSLSIKQTLLGVTGNKGQSTHSTRTEQERNSRDDCSPPRDKAAWKRGLPGLKKKPEKKCPAGVTFGVRLDSCPPAHNNRYVPLIVEVCCKLVEERGLEYTGIYRVPGNNAAISSMQEELDTKGISDIDVQDDKWRDLNVISSLLKSFFRKLPDPLFTNEKYSDFIEANRKEDGVERLKALKCLIRELPGHHYETLKFLSGHLKTVSENCEKNKMEPRNLAIVFGPTLVRTSEDNMTHMVKHMPDQYKIVETLIQHYDWFFTEDGDEDPVAVVEQDSTVQSQPVPNIDHLLSNIGRTAASPGDGSDSTASDSAKSKGYWPCKEQNSTDLVRASIFVNRKRKKTNKPQPSSSDDDLDAVFSKKELQEESDPNWPADDQTDEAESEVGVGSPHQRPEEGEPGKRLVTAPRDQERQELLPQQSVQSIKRSKSPRLNYNTQMARQNSFSDPISNFDEGCVSDLGTLNSTSSQASVPRARQGRTMGPWSEGTGAGAGLGAEVCSITSDYSTTSSMTFLTGVESSVLSPEVRSVAESRGDEADDERSELVSEGRHVETDSESDLSMFTVSREGGQVEESSQPDGSTTPLPDGPGILPCHRIVAGDTLARKRGSRHKTDSESSADGALADEPGRPCRVLDMDKPTSSPRLARSESERTEATWRLKITDRLKCRLRTSADDMFGVGSQRTRSPESRSKRKTNIRRRHTMGGQRDFAELSVVCGWPARGTELSAVDRLKPRCGSQDFSITEWIARERHRTSNPEVSLATAEPPTAQGLELGSTLAPSCSNPTHVLNGDAPPAASQSRSLSLASDAHPHKLSGSQVVRSRFYQYL
ncbi:rho GTPase-activating protein 21 isoform X2 [Electrophorus electricus]|uniref:rho GTPase-activating protein 21 isoform X2 n=1 Tax=Electrophorus electricus TaxID=8005 RepID=UPI0015CF94C6|nr:rho GTPase-activating protein 21 isoform X2 [Electrophorus electricus]